jgi:sodium/bile acid cotransporter 7
VDFQSIVVGLLLLVVLPILAAQALRQWRAIGTSATRHKAFLSFLAQCGVLLMVFIGAVACGERLADIESGFSTSHLAVMIVAVAAVHVALLLLGFNLAQLLRLGRADAIAVAFSGSQKTLMVGVFVAMAIGPLAILPMVAYHAAQLVIDTLVADWLRRQTPQGVEVVSPPI